MQKLNRFYRAEFQIGNTDNGRITKTPYKKFTISYPYTLQLNTKVGFYSTSAQAELNFYNIPQAFQKDLWKDTYERQKWIKVQLYAGYGIKQVLIFSGYVMKGYTYRKGGETDFITELECSAAPDLFSTSQANVTLDGGTSGKNVYLQLLDGVTDCGVGYISGKVDGTKRATPFIGNVFNVINETFSKYNVFVDEQGLLNVLADDEVKANEILTITAESGLLGSPRRQEAVTMVEMLFEPNAKAGMLVNVLSDSMPDLNRTYQVLEVTHTGIISNSECGKLTTKLWLSMGKNAFTPVKKVPENEYRYEGKTSSGFIRPVNGKITSTFSPERMHPIFKKVKPHNGIDIGANMNTPIKAPANGKIIFSGIYGGYGNCIMIDHGKFNGKRITTLFGHLSKREVVAGNEVNQGDKIGLVGSTGDSTGPHLHYEVRENNCLVNPVGRYY
jgi:murein DD-endopeptidase MepM/ murein hydrolase activator NlpD